MARKKLLVTGAGGYVSSLMLPALRERYDLVLLDARREGGRGAGAVDPDRIDPIADMRDEIVEVDLADPDVERYRSHFKGVDCIIDNVFVNAVCEVPEEGAASVWGVQRPPHVGI